MTPAVRNAAEPPGRDDREQASPDAISPDLEHDQIVAGTDLPVRRAQLGRRAIAGLWALRIFVIVVTAMVIYSFVSQLGHGS